MNLSESLFAWWSARESRERKLLLTGAVFAVAAALYTLVNPLLSMHRASLEEFRVVEGDYRWLKEQVLVLAEIRSEAGGALPVYLSPERAKARIEAGMKEKALKGKVSVEAVDGGGRVEVMLENSEGRKVMRWLEELANGGYAISEISLSNNRGRLAGSIVIEV